MTMNYKPTILIKGERVGMVLTKFQLHVIDVAIAQYKGESAHKGYKPLREATKKKSGITTGVLGETGALHKAIKKALEDENYKR